MTLQAQGPSWALSNPWRYLEIMLHVRRAHARGLAMDRRIEPDLVTTNPQAVHDYDQVRHTPFMAFYAAVVESALRLAPKLGEGRLLDLALGPGHLSLLLHRALRPTTMLGIDMSREMLERAHANARAAGIKNIQLIREDGRHLRSVDTNSQDMAVMSFALHHLATQQDAMSVLDELDRVVDAAGTVLIFDVARLPDPLSTEDFVYTAGREYHRLGLSGLYEDFRNSMYAAWSCEEFTSFAPTSGKRSWWHLRSRGLLNPQALIGLPHSASHTLPWRRPGQGWTPFRELVPKQYWVDAWIARRLFVGGPVTAIERVYEPTVAAA